MKFKSLLTLACCFTPSYSNAIGIIDDLRELIPPEYFDIQTVNLEQSFPNINPQVAKSRCRSGHRIGTVLGRDMVQRLGPSCDDLLFPLGEGEQNEWSVPTITFSETTDPATLCSYAGYAAAFEQTVLNTTLNCAKTFNSAITFAIQLEYNRCYSEAANLVTTININIAKAAGFITGDFVVMPQNDDQWDYFLSGLIAITGADGQAERSGYLVTACELAKSHAIRTQPPVNFFSGERVELTEIKEG